MINDLLENFSETELKLSEVDGDTLKQVIIYLDHYKSTEPQKIAKPIPSEKKLSDVTDKWDIDFLENNKDLEEIKNLIIASEYMRISSLHELVCCHVGCIMKDLDSADDIVKYFGIIEDITEEEMKKMEEDDYLEQKKEREYEQQKKKEHDEMIALHKTSIN